MTTRNHYSTFPSKISKEDAKSLLRTIRTDKEQNINRERRAVVWAIDIQGLTMQETAHELGYNSKSWIHALYHQTKGGKP